MKPAYESNEASSLVIIGLFWTPMGKPSTGDHAGRILIRYGRDGASRVTADVTCFRGPLRHLGAGSSITGTAGGGGYCKASAAVGDALERKANPDKRVRRKNLAEIEERYDALSAEDRDDMAKAFKFSATTVWSLLKTNPVHGRGISEVHKFMQALGYYTVPILNA